MDIVFGSQLKRKCLSGALTAHFELQYPNSHATVNIKAATHAPQIQARAMADKMLSTMLT
jgi:hypothetical protein